MLKSILIFPTGRNVRPVHSLPRQTMQQRALGPAHCPLSLYPLSFNHEQHDDCGTKTCLEAKRRTQCLASFLQVFSVAHARLKNTTRFCFFLRDLCGLFLRALRGKKIACVFHCLYHFFDLRFGQIDGRGNVYYGVMHSQRPLNFIRLALQVGLLQMVQIP